MDTIKDLFPYLFVNKDNLNYEGVLPDLKYYENKEDNLDLILKYQNLRYLFNEENKWKMKEETLKYLTKYIICLHQMLIKIDHIIFSNYRLNITSYITISSLSIAILRSNFLKNDNVLPKSKGSLEKAIRSAYFGGRCEIFKPFGYNLNGYDFNSLYPYAMLKDLPVGQPTYSLIKDLDKIFGYVKVKVTSPDNIYIPVLPCRVKSKFGDYKLCFPSGTWIGWYFSEEVKLAKKYGYKVEVIESFIFKRGIDILKPYVDHMASIKDNSVGAMRDIHKLLLNTPYGRLGMNNDRDIIKIVNFKKYQDIELTYKLLTVFQLNEDKYFVRYSKYPDPIKCNQRNIDYDELFIDMVNKDIVNNSPAVAGAIAAWGRILMYPNIINSYYSDTDSIFTKKPINQKLIGKEIGKFKKEYEGEIKKGVFASPKLYILDTLAGFKRICKGYSGDKLTIWEYMDLYRGKVLNLKDVRWIRDLEFSSVKSIDVDYTLKSEYDKRNILYSKGRWVDTSPLRINYLFQIVNMALILFEGKRDIMLFVGKFKTNLIKFVMNCKTDIIIYKANILDLVLIYKDKVSHTPYPWGWRKPLFSARGPPRISLWEIRGGVE